MSVQYVPTGPSRGEAYAGVLHDLLVDTPRAQQAAQARAKTAEQDRRDKLVTEYMKITDPQQRKAGARVLREMGINVPEEPTPEPTAEEMLGTESQNYLRDAIKRGQDPKMALGDTPAENQVTLPTGGAFPMVNVPMGHVPSPYDRVFAASTARAVAKTPMSDAERSMAETQAVGGTSALTRSNAIATKREMDAKDAASVPSEVELRNAQAANQRSEVPLHAAQTENQRAGAAKIGAETTGIKATNDLLSSGGDNPKVQNYVRVIKAGAERGVPPEKILKQIKDKNMHRLVTDELVKPENQAALAATPLGEKTKQTLADLDPIIAQAQKVAKAFEPYKDDNGFFTGRDLADYALYTAGKKPPDDSPASQIANLQMMRIQAGARLLKGSSRAYQALEEAMKHAGNGKETRAQIYDKTMKLLTQLEEVRADQIRYGVPVTAEQATAMNPVAPKAPVSVDGKHPVSKAEWDALIQKGHTPQDLAASGIVLQ